MEFEGALESFEGVGVKIRSRMYGKPEDDSKV